MLRTPTASRSRRRDIALPRIKGSHSASPSGPLGRPMARERPFEKLAVAFELRRWDVVGWTSACNGLHCLILVVTHLFSVYVVPTSAEDHSVSRSCRLDGRFCHCLAVRWSRKCSNSVLHRGGPFQSFQLHSGSAVIAARTSQVVV